MPTTRTLPLFLVQALHTTVTAVRWPAVRTALIVGDVTDRQLARVSTWADQPLGHGGHAEVEAVRAVARLARLSDLDTIFDALTQEEFNAWRQFLTEPTESCASCPEATSTATRTTPPSTRTEP
jgi:hypothetical protein